MSAIRSDTVFAGSIPELYQSLLVPLIFEPYATHFAKRVAELRPSHVLEVAAGTGAATRAIAKVLPAEAELVATDLNQPMLDRAATVGMDHKVEWRQADALHLPFADATFDVVVCQFGVMFFPDVTKAFAEARRVLRRGGALLFSVWDRLEQNEFAEVVTEALARIFPSDPPRFLARTPHGYHDPGVISRDLSAAGFVASPCIETLAERSRAATPAVPAIAYCQGTPVRTEIVERSGTGLAEATGTCAAAISRRFGAGAVDGKIQAHLVSIGA